MLSTFSVPPYTLAIRYTPFYDICLFEEEIFFSCHLLSPHSLDLDLTYTPSDESHVIPLCALYLLLNVFYYLSSSDSFTYESQGPPSNWDFCSALVLHWLLAFWCS